MPGREHYGKWLIWALVTLAVLGLAGWFFVPAARLSAWRAGPPPELWASARRQQALWNQQGLKRPLRWTFVPLEEVSEHLLVAVLVGEDINFFSHPGVDLRAWPEAFKQWLAGSRLRGASTLSQQLAKNLFLRPERSLLRKLQELRWAIQLERQLGKRRILELYVNVVEFGPGLYGAEAAAQAYFGCPAKALDAKQAAALAATIPSPSQDNPRTQAPRFRARQEVIRRRMGKAHWLYPLVERVRQR